MDQQHREKALLVILLLVLFGIVCVFGILWHSRTYKPGMAAGRALTDLTSSLRRSGIGWIQTSDVSIRGIWAALAPIYTNDKVEIAVHGNWANAPVSIQFKLNVGMPETGFWGRLNSIGDSTGAYQPPLTSLRLLSTHPLAKRAGLERASKPQSVSGGPEHYSQQYAAYGEEAEITRFFNPSVVALLRSFPRDLFGPSFQGPLIEGNEIRLSWEGHEADPKVIEAAFILLKAISESGAAPR